MRAVIRRIALLGALGLAAGPAYATPKKADVVLCGDRTLFLRTGDGNGLWPEPRKGETEGDGETYRVTLFEVPKDIAELVIGGGGAREVASAAAEWQQRGRVLRAPFPAPLLGGSDLVARVELRSAGGVEWHALGNLSTRPKATAVPSAATAEAAIRIDLFSQTPLAEAPGGITVTEVVAPAGVKPTPGGAASPVREIVREHRAVRDDLDDPESCEEPPGVGSSPAGFVAASHHVFVLTESDRLGRGSHSLRVGPLTDIFGQEVSASGKIPPPPVPKGKADAAYYVAGQFESAKGTPDSLTLDLGIKPSIFLGNAWIYEPELSASLSRNLPKASNSIRVASLWTRAFRGVVPHWTDGTLSLGPSVEADRDFDRVNALFDLRWKPALKGLYQSREVRRDRLVTTSARPADEVFLPDWGYGLEGWLGLEAGRSVREQTVKGGGGKEDLEIPGYDIARVRVQLQGFVEYRRLTLTVASGLRYLTTEELVSRKDDDGDLVLVELDEARPYTEATLALALDRTRNVSLALTYKDGSEPPIFGRVDKYTLGVVAKY